MIGKRKAALALPCLAATGLLAAPVQAQVPQQLLDTVRVEVGSRASATLPTQTRGVEVIGAETLARLPVRSVGEALDWALGLDVMPRSPAQADVAVRGSSFEQVLVLIDGVRVSDPQTGHFHLNLAVPLAQVERIEVLRGVASALYGSDAVGGVINIVTRRGPAADVSLRGERGSFGTSALAAAARAGGRLRLDVAGDLQQSNGHRPGTDYRIMQGRLAVEAPLAGRTLRAHAAHAARDFGADGFYAAFPSYEETRTTTAGFAWLAAPGARGGVDVRASHRVHDDDFVLRREDPAFYRNLHTSTQTGGEVVGRLPLTSALQLAGGAEAFREALRSTNLGDREEHRAGVYGEAAVRPGRTTMLSAGLRSDWHSAYGHFAAPSLAGAWWPLGALRVRASLGRAFRAPTWTERYYRDPQNVGTPDLAPERAWSGEAGVEYMPLPGTRVGVAGWVRRADGLIDWARMPGSDEPWRTRNVGSARFHGLEADAEATLLGLGWTAQAAWLRFETEDAEGLTSKYALRPLTHTLSLGAGRTLPLGMDATVRGRYARRAGTALDASASGCVVGAAERSFEVDARIVRRIRRANLFADVRNALDRHSCDIAARPAPGRALSLGVQWGGV
jgi:vitamin B12 transporter